MNKLPVEHAGAFSVRRQQPHHERDLQLIVEREPATEEHTEPVTRQLRQVCDMKTQLEPRSLTNKETYL